MSNYRIRMLPGRLMPVTGSTRPDDHVIWEYEPTGKLYAIPDTATVKEVVRTVVDDLTREWERLTNEQMSCPSVQ